MTTNQAISEQKRQLDEVVAESRAIIAAERQRADLLVAEDGSVEARRHAKSIRISMTKWERSTDRILAWVESEHEKSEVAS